MPLEQETTATVTGTSGVVVSGYGSTFMTGFIDWIYVKADAATTTSLNVKITTSSTANVLFTAVNPMNVGVYYRPRALAYTGGTTTLTATHPSSAAVPVSLYKERMKVNVVSSTAIAACGHVISVRMRVNPQF